MNNEILSDIAEYKEIEVEKILVWDKNPRLYIGDLDITNSSVSYNEDKQAIIDLIHYESNQSDDEEKFFYKNFYDLCCSLISNGFDQTEDNIFIKQNINKENYFVLEGNRRISAIKFLRHFKDWIEDFSIVFGNEFKEKITKKYQSWNPIKKQALLKPNFSIHCWVIKKGINNDDIWPIILSRNNLNKLGKSPWTRINYFIHIKRKTDQIVKQNPKISMDDLLSKLEVHFRKHNISNDFKKSIWVISCLRRSGRYKTDNDMFKLKVSALELSLSKIKDPFTNQTFHQLFNIQYNDYLNWNFIITNKSQANYINHKIDEESLSKFLVENYFIYQKYDTRGWKFKYNTDLIDYLYPNLISKSSFSPWLQTTILELKDLIKKDKDFIQKNEENIDAIYAVIRIYKSLTENLSIIRKHLLSLKQKIYPVINKINSDYSNSYSSLVVFYSIIDAFLQENITEFELNSLILCNFPFSKFGLMARSFYEKLFLALIINDNSRKKLISLENYGSQELLTDHLKKSFSEFEDNYDDQIRENWVNEINFYDFFKKNKMYSFNPFYCLSKISRNTIVTNGKSRTLTDSFKLLVNDFSKYFQIENSFLNELDKLSIFTQVWNSENSNDKSPLLDDELNLNNSQFFNDHFYSWLCTLCHWDFYDLKNFNKISQSQILKWFDLIKKYIESILNFIVLCDKLIQKK